MPVLHVKETPEYAHHGIHQRKSSIERQLCYLCRGKLAIRVAKLDSSFVLGDVLSPGADAVVPRACDLVGEWFRVAEGSGGGEDGEFGGFICIVGEDKFILVGYVAEFVFDGFLIADVFVLLPMVLA
jgi:hypothetical protein